MKLNDAYNQDFAVLERYGMPIKPVKAPVKVGLMYPLGFPWRQPLQQFLLCMGPVLSTYVCFDHRLVYKAGCVYINVCISVMDYTLLVMVYNLPTEGTMTTLGSILL